MLEVPDVGFIRPCGGFLRGFITAWTGVVVGVMLVVCSVSVFLSMCLFVLYFTVLLNCLSHAFALSVAEVKVFA